VTQSKRLSLHRTLRCVDYYAILQFSGGGPSARGLGDVLTTTHRKNLTTLRTSLSSLGTGLILRYNQSDGSEQGQVVGSGECGNEPSDSTKCGELLEQLRTCELLRKASPPWSWLLIILCLCWLQSRRNPHVMKVLVTRVLLLQDPVPRQRVHKSHSTPSWARQS
jgi:hypothetical protein